MCENYPGSRIGPEELDSLEISDIPGQSCGAVLHYAGEVWGLDD
jgi:hypothetical protein